MKCVKDQAGNVVRISDEKAESFVRTGKYSYCPKRDWKERGRK